MTKIEWTDETWNPITGCTKVSAGCKHCYAERLFPRVYGERPFTDVQLHLDRLEQPLRWRKPRMVFVNSMSDLFHESVTESQVRAIFTTMAQACQHTFQVLTKRPKRMMQMLNQWHDDGLTLRSGYTRRPLPNIWLGVSIEDQETADERLIYLRDTPAAVRFVSYEPALGPWDPRRTYAGNMNINALDFLDWVIVGGESGPKARPVDPAWARQVRDQCVEAGVPFFFKQWGKFVSPAQMPEATWQAVDAHANLAASPGGIYGVGKKAAGRELDGRTWDEMPRRQ